MVKERIETAGRLTSYRSSLEVVQEHGGVHGVQLIDGKEGLAMT